MRVCFSCHGEKMVEDVYQCEGEQYYEGEIISGIVAPCHVCEGRGEVEGCCYCYAYCSCECLCGRWDDTPCTCWDC